MMHTGMVLGRAGRSPVQLSVGARRVQLSFLDGPVSSARVRDVAITERGDRVIDLSLRGECWTIELDDPERFRWHVFPRLGLNPGSRVSRRSA